jgi:threonyl-tRNA synthetase
MPAEQEQKVSEESTTTDPRDVDEDAHVVRITVHADGTQTQVPVGSTAREALDALDLMRGRIVAARVDGEPWDLDRPVPEGAVVAPVHADTEEGRSILRHSVAHLMAQAVTDLYPDAKYAIGPPVEDGFYYDFDVEQPFTPEDLERIEDRIHELIREKQRFVREELGRDEALELFDDQPYKREIIEKVDPSEVAPGHGQDGATITVYRNVVDEGAETAERWVDLCRGPHLPSSGWVPAFKLLRTAGAYWRGDESRRMLQRIYGTAWESRKALDAHLTMLEEAKERDHRKLGRELELVHFTDELGPGLSIFLPKGALVRKLMEDWARDEHLARGYQPVYTPHVAKEDLWRTSGHLENYGELMFPGMELEEGGAAYRLKPMNCPFHILAFKSKVRSYRELPLRLSELGTVYRYEKSGVVNAMLRARGFTQDDSHIFCTRDQVVDEVVGVIAFTLDLYRDFGFGEPSRVAVSTRPEKSIGADADWKVAEEALVEAVGRAGLEHEIDEGEGAFYGPKIDMHARDAIGREWQLSTIQVDFNLPERLDVTYVAPDGEHRRPFMIHRALFGSIERFFAVMVESFNGAFPTWLAPVQLRVLPVAADFVPYAQAVAAQARTEGLRVEVDDSDDTLGNMIRRGQTEKIPYLAVVGGNEAGAQTVSIRPYRGEQRRGVPLHDFLAEVSEEARERRTGSS